MKKIVSLNVSDTTVYDKSSLEVRMTSLCRYCLKMSLMVALFFSHGWGTSPLQSTPSYFVRLKPEIWDNLIQSPDC